MSRFNVLRNCLHLTRNLINSEQRNIIRCYTTNQLTKTSIYSTAINSPLRTSTFDSTLQSPVLQLAKAAVPKVIQTRTASTGGDHVRLWQIERLLSAALIPLLPAALLSENALLESLLALSVVAHTHWGLEAIVVDYARPAVIGNILAKVAHLSLYVLSAVTLAGLLVLIFNGPGLSKAIKKGWAIGKEK